MDVDWQSWRLLTNIITLLILIAVFVVFEVYPIVPPYQRGFNCYDDSINKPYIESETISTSELIIATVLLCIGVVVICELLKMCLKTCNGNEKKVTLCGSIQIPASIYRVLSRVCLMIVGLLMSLIVVDVAKKMVGGLRPHFLAVCKPDYSRFNCTDKYTYITADVCTNTDYELVAQARLSFPSGHGAASGFVSLVTALYIEYAIQIRPLPLLKPLVQYVLICLGLAGALTRISDYYHHWSDVLVGLLIGMIHAVYTIYYLIRLPKEEKRDKDQTRTAVPTHVTEANNIEV